jgi:hypothetical protein
METKDWLVPLAVSSFTSVVTLFGAYWLQKFKEREKLNLHIGWENWEVQYEGHLSAPILFCHNKSDMSIQITDVAYFVGRLFRRRCRFDSALYFDEDYIYTRILPQVIEPNAVYNFRLDDSSAQRLIVALTKIDRLFHFFGRDRLWVQITTSANTRVRISALNAIPSQIRPIWLF